ncbi:unnamed protein product [Closterium sp. NIES-64]|nr:unnamed protein product [Closterium sp. NIES-64]
MWTLICRVAFPAGSIPSRIESTHLLPPLSCSPRTLPPTPPPSLCSPPLPLPSLCAPPLPHHSVPHPSPITLFPTPPPSLCSPPLPPSLCSPPLPHHSVPHPSPITLFPIPPPSLCSPPLPHHSVPHHAACKLTCIAVKREAGSLCLCLLALPPFLLSSLPTCLSSPPCLLPCTHCKWLVEMMRVALSPGSHTLQVAAPGAFFLPVVLQVSAKHAGSFRAVVIREQGPASLSIDPLIISPFAAEEYLERRQPFSIWTIVKSPMGIMICFMLVVMVVLPRLADSIDPEEMKQMQEQMQQQQVPSLSGLLSGNR